MTFEEILDQAIAMLQRRRRVTYRTLKLHFQLDEEQLAALAEALIEAEQLAIDEAGKVLVWTPHLSPRPAATTSTKVRDRLLLLLASVAGAVDAVSYLKLGRVFTANMTGNTVLLGLAIGQAESQAAVRSSLALGGFLAGVALGTRTATRGRQDGVWPPAVTRTLMWEGVLLVAIAVGWYLVGDLGSYQAATSALITLSALAMGVQSAVGRYLNISGIATTYITGTLTSLIAGLVAGARGMPATQASPKQLASTIDSGYLAPSVGLLAATWVIYIGGAATAATIIVFLGPLLALVLPITLLMVAILTARLYFRRR